MQAEGPGICSGSAEGEVSICATTKKLSGVPTSLSAGCGAEVFADYRHFCLRCGLRLPLTPSSLSPSPGAGGDAGAAAGDACGPERDMGGAAEGTDAEAEAAATEAAAAAAAAGAAEQQQHQPLRRREAVLLVVTYQGTLVSVIIIIIIIITVIIIIIILNFFISMIISISFPLAFRQLSASLGGRRRSAASF